MLYNRNYHSVVGKLFFKNKLIEKEMRFVLPGVGGWREGGIHEDNQREDKINNYKECNLHDK